MTKSYAYDQGYWWAKSYLEDNNANIDDILAIMTPSDHIASEKDVEFDEGIKDAVNDFMRKKFMEPPKFNLLQRFWNWFKED